ncbi:hypothetical protein C8F01DRAFT_587987 [Mycena amicta]|nr:hypothetical protein C8F01DRAFT_587987 [Mycena amicta]
MDLSSFSSTLLDGPCFGDLSSSQSTDASSPLQTTPVPQIVDQLDSDASAILPDARINSTPELHCSEESKIRAYTQLTVSNIDQPQHENDRTHQLPQTPELDETNAANNTSCAATPALPSIPSCVAQDHAPKPELPVVSSTYSPKLMFSTPSPTPFSVTDASDRIMLSPKPLSLDETQSYPKNLCNTNEPPSSSPPSSISEQLFSSSPPLTSDSSIEKLQMKFEDPDLSALPALITEPCDGDDVTEDEIFELPPSSSPVRSSSPVAETCMSEIDDDELEDCSKMVVEEVKPLPEEPKVPHETEVPEDNVEEPVPEVKNQDVEIKVASSQPPNPIRRTAASQKTQRKLLTKPFRPPTIIKKTKAPEPAPLPPPAEKEPTLANPTPILDLKKHRTQRASAQFKSPLPTSASSSLPSVRQTPTIQILERRLQVLRRAVKLKQDGEEETLEALVAKWTEAGREIAWEVWGLVKDNETASGETGKRKLDGSWGWGEDTDSKRVKVEERNWGWDVAPVVVPEERAVEASEEDDKPKETMGSMLMRMGIALETLGWNEEEGEFMDRDD